MRGIGSDGAPRRALVTGSGGGIGRAIVARLASEGYDVVTLDVADADVVCDLSSDDVDFSSFGGAIDVCVSNAGIVDTISPAARMSREKWERDVAVNLSGAFRVVQACLPSMIARRSGRIVVISSLAALAGSPGQIAYAASKAGLLGMVRGLAAEHAALGITANAVCPGMIATPKVLAMPPDVQEAIRGRMLPTGRLGQPEEVAGLVAYLASEEAGYVTGQSIAIDGAAALNTLSLGRQ